MRYAAVLLAVVIAAGSRAHAQEVASLPPTHVPLAESPYEKKPTTEVHPSRIWVLMPWLARGFKDAERPFDAKPLTLRSGETFPLNVVEELTPEVAQDALAGHPELVILACPLIPGPDGRYRRIPIWNIELRKKCRIYGRQTE